MFWKKKTSDEDLFEYASDNRRESFRLNRDVLGPAKAAYKGRDAQIINISAGGISFECKNCSEGETGDLLLELPGQTVDSLTLPIKIIKISSDINCHCQFTIINEEAVEIIHQYVLIRQIAAQRKLRAEEKEKSEPDD